MDKMFRYRGQLFRVINVRGDGNCFFYAMGEPAPSSRQSPSDRDAAMLNISIVRTRVANYLRQKPFPLFPGQPADRVAQDKLADDIEFHGVFAVEQAIQSYCYWKMKSVLIISMRDSFESNQILGCIHINRDGQVYTPTDADFYKVDHIVMQSVNHYKMLMKIDGFYPNVPEAVLVPAEPQRRPSSTAQKVAEAIVGGTGATFLAAGLGVPIAVATLPLAGALAAGLVVGAGLRAAGEAGVDAVRAGVDAVREVTSGAPIAPLPPPPLPPIAPLPPPPTRSTTQRRLTGPRSFHFARGDTINLPPDDAKPILCGVPTQSSSEPDPPPPAPFQGWAQQGGKPVFPRGRNVETGILRCAAPPSFIEGPPKTDWHAIRRMSKPAPPHLDTYLCDAPDALDDAPDEWPPMVDYEAIRRMAGSANATT